MNEVAIAWFARPMTSGVSEVRKRLNKGFPQAVQRLQSITPQRTLATAGNVRKLMDKALQFQGAGSVSRKEFVSKPAKLITNLSWQNIAGATSQHYLSKRTVRVDLYSAKQGSPFCNQNEKIVRT